MDRKVTSFTRRLKRTETLAKRCAAASSPSSRVARQALQQLRSRTASESRRTKERIVRMRSPLLLTLAADDGGGNSIYCWPGWWGWYGWSSAPRILVVVVDTIRFVSFRMPGWGGVRPSWDRYGLKDIVRAKLGKGSHVTVIDSQEEPSNKKVVSKY